MNAMGVMEAYISKKISNYTALTVGKGVAFLLSLLVWGARSKYTYNALELAQGQ